MWYVIKYVLEFSLNSSSQSAPCSRTMATMNYIEAVSEDPYWVLLLMEKLVRNIHYIKNAVHNTDNSYSNVYCLEKKLFVYSRT